MVRIEIDDEVWQVYKKSWALMGVRTEEKLIAYLEDDLWEKSLSVIEDSERQRARKLFFHNAPHSYFTSAFQKPNPQVRQKVVVVG
jgi:hypothetical protein